MPKQASKKAAKKPTPQRVTILGHSATSVLKWMGANDWTSEAAAKALAKLAEGGEVKPSTISTGLSDGRNPLYSGSAAKLTAKEVSRLKAAAK